MPDEFSSSGGGYLADTQLIGTISIDASQTQTRAQRVKLLGSNEDNKIVDSSCDFRDSLDTQQLLDEEPDTVLISEEQQGPGETSSSSGANGKSQVEDGKKSQDSQALFKHFKLPDTADSPWMNHVKNPFEDTPINNNKINLLGETPMNTKVRSPFAETPETIMSKRRVGLGPVSTSFNTPSGHTAHKIFNRLRQDQADQMDVEVDTQPVPSLAFDTQIGNTPTTQQNLDDDISDTSITKLDEDKTVLSVDYNDDADDTIADVPNRLDKTFDISVDNDNHYQETSSQAALQIPGTAPEEPDVGSNSMNGSFGHDGGANDGTASAAALALASASSPVVSEDEDQDQNNTNNDTNNDSSDINRNFGFNAEDSIQITHDRDVSDKPRQSSPHDTSRFHFPKSLPLLIDSPLANTYRIVGNSTSGAHSDSFPRDRKSQLLVEETPSRPAHTRSDILPLGSGNRIVSSPTLFRSNSIKNLSDTIDDAKLSHEHAVSTSQPVPLSSSSSSDHVAPEGEGGQILTRHEHETSQDVATGAKVDSTPTSVSQLPSSKSQQGNEEAGSQFDLVHNVTQDLSDIDDESKIDATMDEENTTKFLIHDDDGDSRIFRPRRARKRAMLAVSSPDTSKRQRSSPLKTTQSDLQDEGITGKKKHSRVVPNADVPPDIIDYDNDQVMHEANDINIDQLEPFSSLSSLESTAKAFPKTPLMEDKLVLTTDDIISKNSVWHLYETFFYPGIAVGVDGDIPVVKFNDRTQQATGLFPLDIRIGDIITHDDSEYEVVGLDCLNDGESGDVIRCMRGYDTTICRKIKKVSRKKNNSKKVDVRFPLADIKMAEKFWLLTDRVGSTPGGRTFGKPTVTFEDSLIRSFSRMPIDDPTKIFNGCLFTLTGLDDKAKNELEDLIKSNGGVVADNGFESYSEVTSDKKCLRQRDRSLTSFNFAALITGKPSRFPKYFEALALGWPVLSYEYIYHCHQEGVLLKNLSTYLLPSGASKTLHGTIKSFDIGTFVSNWQRDFDLSLQLANNRILTKKCVLIVDADPPIAPFLFHALGAQSSHIKITNNSKLLSDCSTVLSDGKSPIYIYGRSKNTLHKALKGLESGNSKRSSVLKQTMRGTVAPVQELELIDWEWLAECIISGHPWRSTDVIKIKP